MWYGSYGLPVNGVSSTVRYRAILSDSGRPVRYVGTIDVTAHLDGDGQASLTATEEAFNAACRVPYRDLVLKQDSGAASGTKLITNRSLSGVRIIDGPNYTNEAGDGEYVIRRVCRFTAEASYLITGAENAYLSFSESITVLGTGGPLTTWRAMVNGPPVQQVIYPATTRRVIQTGMATGHLREPVIPGPIWPYPIEVVTRRRHTRGSPRREGPSAFIEPTASWSYEYESSAPLVALPGRPPI